MQWNDYFTNILNNFDISSFLAQNMVFSDRLGQ